MLTLAVLDQAVSWVQIQGCKHVGGLATQLSDENPAAAARG